jgi:hypothetical protein
VVRGPQFEKRCRTGSRVAYKIKIPIDIKVKCKIHGININSKPEDIPSVTAGILLRSRWGGDVVCCCGVLLNWVGRCIVFVVPVYGGEVL